MWQSQHSEREKKQERGDGDRNNGGGWVGVGGRKRTDPGATVLTWQVVAEKESMAR